MKISAAEALVGDRPDDGRPRPRRRVGGTVAPPCLLGTCAIFFELMCAYLVRLPIQEYNDLVAPEPAQVVFGGRP
jgi:hypothetical protein